MRRDEGELTVGAVIAALAGVVGLALALFLI
jgi:hypothetical protein